MAATTYELIVKTVDQTSGPMGRITGGLGKGKIAFAAVAAAATAMGKAMLDASKQMETIQNQLRLVTKNSADLAATQTRLTQLARANRSTLGPTVELYTKLKVATEELGFSNERVEGLVTKLQQALVVAGADAGTAAGVIKQFGQAMASGTVRGDEFNSIVEGMGPALAIMARESGITVGQLREMSQNGELTAEAFAKMLEGSKELTASFQKMQTPLDTLEAQLSEAFTTYLANLSEATGLTGAYRTILESLLSTFDKQNEAFGANTESIQGLITTIKLLREEQQGLATDASGHTGRQARLRAARIQEEIDAMQKRLDVMRQAEISDRRLIALAKEHAEAQNDKTDAVTESIPALTQYEQFLAKLVESARAAATEQGFEAQAVADLRTQLEQGKISIDAYAIAMERLGQGTKAVKEETRTATPVISEFDKFFNRLVETANRSANEINFKSQAVAKLGEQLALGRISIDAYAQAMLALGHKTKETKTAIEGTTKTVSQFDQFMNRLVESSSAAVTEQNHMAMAQGRLNELLAEGKINIDQYAEAMRRVGGGTDPAKPDIPKAPETPKAPDPTALESFTKSIADQRIAYESLNISTAEQKQLADSLGISYDALRGKLLQAQSGMTIFMSESEKLAFNLEQTMRNVTQSLGMTIAQGIAEGKSLMDTLKNVVKQTLTQILGMILQSQINKALAGLFGGMGGGFGGGGFGMLFGLGRALLGFANGGNPPINRPSIVGEKGPELFMPGTTGRIIPNDELQGGGAAPVVNFNINAIDTQTGTEFILKNKKQIEGVIQSAYDRRGRRGIA